MSVFACAVAADMELDKLRKAVSSAMSQTDMNLTSRELGLYLDQKLTKLELSGCKDLDAGALKLFNEAARSWRVYRTNQSEFEADKYRGGSMRPMIYNLTYSRLTEERISALTQLNPEKG